jgi:hypothetical protein
MIFAFASSYAEPLYGTANITLEAEILEGLITEGGRGLFGHLPEGSIEELATTYGVFTFNSGDYPAILTIPVPIYEDGTLASEAEILFVVRQQLEIYANTSALCCSAGGSVSWYGGPYLQVDAYWDSNLHVMGIRIEVTSYAFRQGSVAAAPLDFGQLKTLFE